MHLAIFIVVVVWLMLLAAATAWAAVVAHSTVVRALALDTLALVFVGVLMVLAIHEREAGFLDVALVLAMLGFVQTVATSRLVERRKDLR